ncbi:MAG: ferrous iron transport protein B [Candidatus Omnitrophica bacterium]|nr:ferrous iron transport protein B [Candidatus Omnitrophota bacterium]
MTGNPNVGKSVIFQLLTGRYTTVSNYPGTTVMVSEGKAQWDGLSFRVFDTPGINSLLASSEDELVARDLLLENPRATVLVVADAKNLRRALTLVLELAETGMKAVLNLNMIDEARERRIAVDQEKLSAILGVPVAATVATERLGIDRLKKFLPQARPFQIAVRYPDVVETALASLEARLPRELQNRRSLGLLWLARDPAVIEELSHRLEKPVVEDLRRIAGQAQAQSASPLALLITQARLRQAQRLTREVSSTEPSRRRPWLSRLGDLSMHRIWGIPILLAALTVMYFLVGDLAAQRGVGFLEETFFGEWIVPRVTWLAHRLIPFPLLANLLVGEYGLLTMALPYALAIILPIVGMFFLCFGFMEDVGYLPRLAVMANRFCRLLGLNGKAVLPLVLGLGCDTMATMTARILDSKRDRVIVTLLLALGIPCSAQLGVILAMLAGQPILSLWIWLGVVLTLLIVVGQIAARVLPGEESPFLYEVPPLRKPKLSNIAVKTLGRVEWYLKEAVPLFFLGTLFLFALDALGILKVLERLGQPLVAGWLGLPAKATGAFLVGFLRRDFGAAGLFVLQKEGALNGTQILVSLVTITLFVPCIAQYFMMIKERGARTATAMFVLVTGISILVGGVLLRVLTALRVSL